MASMMMTVVRRSLPRIMLAIAVLPAAALGASPQQDAALAEMQKKLDASLQMIQALTERVRELEAKQAAATAAPAAATATADNARLESDEQKIEQLEKENASRTGDDTGLPLHGFADVGAGTHNPINPGLKGVYVGNLDFYLAPRLGDHTRALFEMNTEVGPDGTVDVDLERAQIGYQFNDQATVWLGRYHTPYGYVNTALHHGSWINNSLRRPQFLQFEDDGGIMPAHTVGLWLTGWTHAGGGKLVYDVYAGNSQEIFGGALDMRNAGNSHGNMGGGARVGYQFTSGPAEGLTFGVHAFSARIGDDALPANATRVLSYGGYAVYDTDQWEDIAEIYLFDNRDLNGSSGTHRSNAGFLQLGYRARWGVPYARYERTVLEQSDPYFAALEGGGSYHRVALGARFDLDLKSAIKLELANTQLTDRSLQQYGEGLVQYAIRF
ncbi:MAG: hypothetical protein JSR15_11020 [Proteobacteria bacterium]|nr:hypothetical protein [Pseudomonadota bacterium]